MRCRGRARGRAGPAGTTRWSPRCGTRGGYDLGRSSGPAPIIDADEIGAANMILTNGARLYVDHAHPEYSAPEVVNLMDASDPGQAAGERIMGGGRTVRGERARRARARSCTRTTSTASGASIRDA